MLIGIKTSTTVMLGFFLIIQSLSGLAQERIPDSTGLSGFFMISGGILNSRTNLIATGAPSFGQVGEAVIESVEDSPYPLTSGTFTFGGELNYTFGKSRTQIFFGSRLEDILRLDAVIGLGVRQELRDQSIVALTFLTTPITLKFWEDPYVEGIPREKSELNFPGVRLRGSRLFGTGLELTATFRRYNFENERSGEWLVDQNRLEEGDQNLLNRNGDVTRLQAAYWFRAKGQYFVPSVQYVIDSHKGNAIANRGFQLHMTYLLVKPKFILDVDARYGKRAADEIHPVYDETLESDRFGASLTLFYRIRETEKNGLSLFIASEYYRENVNVNFFDSQFTIMNVGLLWRHKQP